MPKGGRSLIGIREYRGERDEEDRKRDGEEDNEGATCILAEVWSENLKTNSYKRVFFCGLLYQFKPVILALMFVAFVCLT